MADWNKIKTEYITTDTSYRKLAQKYGVNATTIAKKAGKEDWVAQRNQQASKTLSKTLAADSKRKADRMARIQDATDLLLDKIEQAITELNIQLAKETHKERVVEYNNPDRPDKPTKEITHETEKILEFASIIDRQGLKQIASALKDIKEVQMLKSELDRQEQEARIANLRKQAESEDDDTEIQVVITGKAKEYAK
jgi:hypothetical protein